MEDSLKKYIRQLNVRNFREQLKGSLSEAEREILLKLLAEEEAEEKVQRLKPNVSD